MLESFISRLGCAAAGISSTAVMSTLPPAAASRKRTQSSLSAYAPTGSSPAEVMTKGNCARGPIP
jgi:hypothetical protein